MTDLSIFDKFKSRNWSWLQQKNWKKCRDFTFSTEAPQETEWIYFVKEKNNEWEKWKQGKRLFVLSSRRLFHASTPFN